LRINHQSNRHTVSCQRLIPFLRYHYPQSKQLTSKRRILFDRRKRIAIYIVNIDSFQISSPTKRNANVLQICDIVQIVDDWIYITTKWYLKEKVKYRVQEHTMMGNSYSIVQRSLYEITSMIIHRITEIFPSENEISLDWFEHGRDTL
jgi:hypothetical protein